MKKLIFALCLLASTSAVFAKDVCLITMNRISCSNVNEGKFENLESQEVANVIKQKLEAGYEIEAVSSEKRMTMFVLVKKLGNSRPI